MSDWQTMASAPKDRMILLWGEVDMGNRSAAACAVMAIWSSDEGMFGEEGGWMVAFTDDSIASVESPEAWQPLPGPPPERRAEEVSQREALR